MEDNRSMILSLLLAFSVRAAEDARIAQNRIEQFTDAARKVEDSILSSYWNAEYGRRWR